MKNSEKSDIYNFFKFADDIDLTDIAPLNIIGLDAKNSYIYINIQTLSGAFREIGGGLTKGYFGSIFNNLKNASMENLGDKLEKTITKEYFITSMKKILFREKILDEVYDKSEEYKNNLEKYEANTDDIIEKIEEKNTEPYNLFIIKHFIKYVMDKYKQENHSSEDNSTNENIENNEDTKNISKNPFIED